MISFSYSSPVTSARPATAPPPHPCVPPPAYCEHKTEPEENVTILLSCPHLSSYLWVLKLYSTVCGGCGTILSFLWLVGHLYVLIQTQDSELKTQRWSQSNCNINVELSQQICGHRPGPLSARLSAPPLLQLSEEEERQPHTVLHPQHGGPRPLLGLVCLPEVRQGGE